MTALQLFESFHQYSSHSLFKEKVTLILVVPKMHIGNSALFERLSHARCFPILSYSVLKQIQRKNVFYPVSEIHVVLYAQATTSIRPSI